MINKSDKPNETVTEESIDEKLWIRVTTSGVLPGQRVNILLEDEDYPEGESIPTSGIVDENGEVIILAKSKSKVEEIVPEGTEEEGKATGQFNNGWWSIDEAGECHITRAVLGMHVYFHVETTIPDGERVHIELYEDDNNEKEETGTGDKDEHQPLVSTATKEPSTHETVNNGKIIKSIILDNFESTIDADVDKQIELYFRCSYNGENVELPHSPSDYLVVGTLVIDRYKMPGLNGNGTDIADDLTYGTGSPQNNPIYNNGQVSIYVKEYTESGFDEQKHALFTNKTNLLAIEPVLKRPTEEPEEDVAEAEPNRFSTLIEETTVKRDNTYVATPRAEDYYRQSEYAAQQATKNLKAKYTRDEMYKAKYGIISTGLDIRVFDNFSDDTLFWDFRETAKLYFARGELQTNLEQMVAKFKSNTGGIYESPILTKHVEKHSSTSRYCMYIENYIAQKIKEETFQKLADIEDKDPTFQNDIRIRRGQGKIKGNDIQSNNNTVVFTRPSYSYKNIWDATKGLTIALNDIWATEVVLKELKNNGENYTAKYQVTLWDHFGLDLPDMEKIFNIIPSVGETFVCWFILQHLRGYKPFVTKMTFEREFDGNINEGREERRAKQKAKENELTPAQQRAWDRATNPLPPGPKW